MNPSLDLNPDFSAKNALSYEAEEFLVNLNNYMGTSHFQIINKKDEQSVQDISFSDNKFLTMKAKIKTISDFKTVPRILQLRCENIEAHDESAFCIWEEKVDLFWQRENRLYFDDLKCPMCHASSRHLKINFNFKSSAFYRLSKKRIRSPY